ncbi:Cell surface glycoprotein MUC18, partial [Ophiophagus hannah]
MPAPSPSVKPDGRDAETNVEVSVPDVVEAEIGETAVINCEFSLPENSSLAYINWFSGEKITRKRIISLLQDKEDWAEDQYKDHLNIAKNFSLIIKKVTPQDAKFYICQVGLGSVGVGENRTKLQVSKAPEPPEVQLAKDGFRAAEPTLQEDTQYSPPDGKLFLPSVMRNDSGLYWCKALDLHTLEELIASVDLMVNFGPQEPVEGEDLVLTCSTTGSGPLKYQWKKKGKLIGDGAVLNLTSITYEKMGNYTCVVTMPDFPGWVRSRHIIIAVRAKPQKVPVEQNLSVREGEVLDLTCTFYSVHTSRRKYHYNSTLSVLVTKEILTSGLNCTETRAQESKGVIIVAVIVFLLVFAVLGAVLYFLHKKGKLACGRSGKQEITRPEAHKDEIVVEVKSDKLPEEAGLLQGANGEKRSPGDQGEKYIDLRN